MTKEAFFEDINSTIEDVIATDYVFNPEDYVPGVDDPNLTYGRGKAKKGVELNTCVLYVDVRDSVSLTESHWDTTMGKIYSAFTACVLKAARETGGFVRNIIGDRVMIVFPSDNCYTKAVDCAVYINQISNTINTKFPNLNFRCGIGIDAGRIRLIKIGIQVNNQEHYENKGLVWVGKPANMASRLTDTANKRITEETYHVEGTKLSFKTTMFGIQSTFPETIEIPHVRDFSTEDYLKAITVSHNKPYISGFHSVNSIKKLNRYYQFPPILMSETVYRGFAKANPNRNSIKNGYWKLQSVAIRSIEFPVYGGNVVWDIK